MSTWVNILEWCVYLLWRTFLGQCFNFYLNFEFVYFCHLCANVLTMICLPQDMVKLCAKENSTVDCLPCMIKWVAVKISSCIWRGTNVSNWQQQWVLCHTESTRLIKGVCLLDLSVIMKQFPSQIHIRVIFPKKTFGFCCLQVMRQLKVITHVADHLSGVNRFPENFSFSYFLLVQACCWSVS